MSDAAIANIVTGIVTVTTIVIGFATLWLKLKYGVEKKADEAALKAAEVEGKIDGNTQITSEVRNATAKVAEHVIDCDEERKTLLRNINAHESRILNLENQMLSLKASVDLVSKNMDSTRHEVRGHLQTLTNKLDLISLTLRPVIVPDPVVKSDK